VNPMINTLIYLLKKKISITMSLEKQQNPQNLNWINPIHSIITTRWSIIYFRECVVKVKETIANGNIIWIRKFPKNKKSKIMLYLKQNYYKINLMNLMIKLINTEKLFQKCIRKILKLIMIQTISKIK